MHGHTILAEETAAQTFDEVGLGSLERLIPGFIEDSAEQATRSADQSGIGSPSAPERGYCGKTSVSIQVVTSDTEQCT